MPIELNPQTRTEAIASLQRYFDENLPEPIGDLPAAMLLDFLLQEIGPAIYNQAVADAQARLQQRTEDLGAELYEEPFGYWSKSAKDGVKRKR